MIRKLVFRLIHLVANPFGFAAVCMLFAGWMFLNRDRLAGGSAWTPDQEFKRVMNEMATVEPRAANTLREITDLHARLGVIAAARSAGQAGDRRPIMASMAREYAEGLTPYRARIAAMSFTDPNQRDKLALESFMMAHASVLETMELSGYGKSAGQYMAYLEQARKNPTLWSLVWDDPLALHIWVETQDIESVRNYHRNREWMADPLALVDFENMDKKDWTLKTAIHRLARFEKTSQKVIQDAELGVLGLSIMLTHGGLVDACTREQNLPPEEVVAVVYMNPDLLGAMEGDAVWIKEKAAWLATIRINHPAVWFAAMESVLALRLFRDAPAYAASVLEKYGYADVPTLIYQHFDKPEVVEAAARALDVYGDLAIYVFQRYDDEHFAPYLAQHLLDPEIGIRVIPFIVRFGDDAFKRIDKDPAWVDRYFMPDGSPRTDPLEWIQFIPGGAAVNVARQWAKGYPCELDELGWAAFDVGTAVLAVVSMGASTPVTQAAKTSSGTTKAIATSIRSGKTVRTTSRAVLASRWSRAVGAFKRTGKLVQLSRVGRASLAIGSFAGKTIWAGIRVVSWAAKTTYVGLSKTIQAWRHLPPAVRKAALRGLLAVALVIRITETTAPNMDKISNGIGALTAKLAVGAVTAVATAVAASVREVMSEMLPRNPLRMTVIFVLVGGLVVLAFGGAFRGYKNRHRIHFVAS